MLDDAMAAVIDALIPQIPFDGWTERSLRQALASIGQAPEDARLIFPGGAGEMIEAFFTLANTRMAEAAAAADLAACRVPARVRAILSIWLEQNRGNREAVRRAFALLSLPQHARRAARITAAMVDTIWHAAGDTSADFSWYTKRGILAAVVASTVLYWLSDTSEEDENTLRFIDRRLEGVSKVGKLRKRVEGRIKGVLPRFRQKEA